MPAFARATVARQLPLGEHPKEFDLDDSNRDLTINMLIQKLESGFIGMSLDLLLSLGICNEVKLLKFIIDPSRLQSLLVIIITHVRPSSLRPSVLKFFFLYISANDPK